MTFKYFFILLIVFSFPVLLQAQKISDYPKQWKTVETLEKKGLTKSALQEVKSIFSLALQSGNEAQQVKSAMYLMKYRNMVEEDNKENNIFFLDTLISQSKTPVKNILQSMQAELFQSYRDNNRYKFYGRSVLSEEKSGDISTWSISKLNTFISSLYKASLNNATLLKKNNMQALGAILQKGKNTQQLRPTIYDFLAHRALAYFMSSENDLIQPAYKFIMNDENIFLPAAEFVNTTIASKDSTSLYYHALKIFRDLLKFHLDDPEADALLDADLLRLSFAYEYGVFTDKDALYEKALKETEHKYRKYAAVSKAIYLRAQLYFNHGQEYDPINNKAPQFEIRRAKELCDSTISHYPDSEGAAQCKNLLNEMNMPLLNFEIEKVNSVDKPFRSLVTYKNAQTLYFRLLIIDRAAIKKMNRAGYEAGWSDLIQKNALREWSVTLPDLMDFQQHAAEIKMAPLPSGTYILMAGLKPDFDMAQNIMAKQVIYVSNISYLFNNKDELYVLDRESGMPLSHAKVQFWQQKYNYKDRNYEEVKTENHVTDVNGFIRVNKTKDVYNSAIQVQYKKDELFLDDNLSYNSYNSYQQPAIKKTFFFTDRSIYRPGQLIYFKGIAVTSDSNRKNIRVAEGLQTTVNLFDANNSKIAGIHLKAGKYGAFNGSFSLPENTLNGLFYLKDSINNSIQYFSVEEYKRPKFYVQQSKPSGTYRVNDSITVNGTARAYAGNNISNAKVNYRVVRKFRYPVWWNAYGYQSRYRPSFSGNNETMEIINGETSTDISGNFSIRFKAIPDERADRKAQPVFHYEITTSITDINGETRNGNSSVAVAYHMLDLDIVGAEKIQADSIRNVRIFSKNLNGLFEKSLVRVSLYSLKSPDRILRERYWDMPDMFTMSYAEYKNNFPWDIYSDENNKKSWPIASLELDRKDSTNEDGSFTLRNGQLQTGWYKMIVTAIDRYGEEATTEKYFLLTDANGFVASARNPINIKTDKTSFEPEEKINYRLSTDFEKIWLIQSILKTEQRISSSYQEISNGLPYKNSILLKEDDRGGLRVAYAFVMHNRLYSGNEYFSIPWSNKELKISYETFRDKLLPGSEEKWKIRISGSKSELVAAEALISMYDASLDQFKEHKWDALNGLWPLNTDYIFWRQAGFTSGHSEVINRFRFTPMQYKQKFYDALINNGWNEYSYYSRFEKSGNAEMLSAALVMDEGLKEVVVTKNSRSFSTKKSENNNQVADSVSVSTSANIVAPETIQVRKNFNETAFFLPELLSDDKGDIVFSFTIPEALTGWKMMTLAHTRNLASGYSEKAVITQKPLMVQPNTPRFLREGDQMEFSAKIINMSDRELTGTTSLELMDALSNRPVDGWFKNIFPVQYFTVPAGGSIPVKFPIGIPGGFNSALTYRIKAVTENKEFSDGEEAVLPILINRMLVTESMPLNMRTKSTQKFTFGKLLSSGKSETLLNHALTVEYTRNPAWYAVQALPYLTEYPYECAEQTFNRYYANMLAAHIVQALPRIKNVFEKWKTSDTAALLSNLQKNESLKSVLLQETPWILDAKDENEQKKQIAVLFDMTRMAREKNNAFNRLKEMQSSNGGFTWFKGGPDDRYMTQYIITGIGHLINLQAINEEDRSMLKSLLENGLSYLDARLKEDYDYLLRHKQNLNNNQLSPLTIQYLYMRSFFPDYNIPQSTRTAYNFYRNQSGKFWLSNSRYLQAMIALSLHRTGLQSTASAIIRSLKENALYNEELGMYWKDYANGGYYWYQAPVEFQALMIEAFSTIENNIETVDALKTWLLKQKQTQNWKTTRATSEACYALLLKGTDWLQEEKIIQINLGNTVINSTDYNNETGTGYFKTSIPGKQVKPEMGNIIVNVSPTAGQNTKQSGSSWGAVYWQYFEDLDKISTAVSPLKIVKKLYKEQNSSRGPVLSEIGEAGQLQVGDRVIVRIEIRTDRDMEYVHMKDMRASCMEPVNVLSGYKYQGGLGYYESTKDASTNFFFDRLNRGTYVFEYPLYVTHSGDFSNGITSIQCMYAPEFSSHSEGIRINVVNP